MSGHTRARTRLVALAAGIVLAPLIAPVIAELGFRVAAALGLAREAGPDEVAALVRRIEGLEFAGLEFAGLEFAPEHARSESASAGDRAMTLHPYLGFQLEHFLALRDGPTDYWASEQSGRNFDVLLLGGSVAAGAIESWKRTFEPLLAADPRFAERPVKLHWRTCPGHKQPQHALNLQWALSLGDRPDLVLLIDGFNEIAVAAQNAEYGVHPLYPMWTEMDAGLSSAAFAPDDLARLGEIGLARREARELARRLEGLPVRSAAFAAYARGKLEALAGRVDGLFGELQTSRAAAAGTRPPLIAGPPFSRDPARIEELSLRAWAEGSRTMQALCAARGIRFVHVLQPAACDAGSKPLSADEAARAREPAIWRTSIESAYPKLRELGARLAAEGVWFVDASGVFREHAETLYRDACHFDEPGYALLAELVVSRVLTLLPEKP